MEYSKPLPPINYPTLYKMAIDSPSCMVAGATGSGKSTTINGLLYTLCCQSPNDIGFVIIDLKKISLLDWEFVPHCLNYIRDVDKVPKIIEKFKQTMDNRYNVMLRDRVDKYIGKQLYLVIDEAADLIDTCPNIIEDLKHISRLGRASGIHLIYATQSPDRKTIPSQLQQNIVFRLGLRCASPLESRQIVNVKGCESLPKYGEGILSSPDFMQPTKVVVPMVDPQIIKYVLDWWK